MAQAVMVQTFGDSLRDLADVVDGARSLVTGAKHAEVPFKIGVPMWTGGGVEAAAKDLGAEVTRHVAETGHLHTAFTVTSGHVSLEVFSIEARHREVRRPVDVTPTLEAVEVA